MKTNRKRLLWIIPISTLIGTIISMAIRYIFVQINFSNPPKNWLYVGIEGFLIIP